MRSTFNVPFIQNSGVDDDVMCILVIADYKWPVVLYSEIFIVRPLTLTHLVRTVWSMKAVFDVFLMF